MKNFEEIKRIIEGYEEILKEKYKVKRIGIFGSYVEERQKGSDLDIL